MSGTKIMPESIPWPKALPATKSVTQQEQSSTHTYAARKISTTCQLATSNHDVCVCGQCVGTSVGRGRGVERKETAIGNQKQQRWNGISAPSQNICLIETEVSMCTIYVLHSERSWSCVKLQPSWVAGGPVCVKHIAPLSTHQMSWKCQTMKQVANWLLSFQFLQQEEIWSSGENRMLSQVSWLVF